MAKSIFNQLSEDKKLEIINYYLVPNSAKDTLAKFNLKNRRDLDRILAEKHINKHTAFAPNNNKNHLNLNLHFNENEKGKDDYKCLRGPFNPYLNDDILKRQRLSSY